MRETIDRWLDQRGASFETTALRSPQDEESSTMPSLALPHAEERPTGASRSTHYIDAAPGFPLFAGMTQYATSRQSLPVELYRSNHTSSKRQPLYWLLVI